MDLKRPDWEKIFSSVEKSNYGAVKREGKYNINAILKSINNNTNVIFNYRRIF